MAEHTIELNATNFEAEVLKSDLPVLVDFWAPWCSPCKLMLPTMTYLGAELAGKVKVAKLNVDDFEHLAAEYRVEGLPTFVVFKAGQEVGRHSGSMRSAKLIEFIDNSLSSS